MFNHWACAKNPVKLVQITLHWLRWLSPPSSVLEAQSVPTSAKNCTCAVFFSKGNASQKNTSWEQFFCWSGIPFFGHTLEALGTIMYI